MQLATVDGVKRGNCAGARLGVIDNGLWISPPEGDARLDQHELRRLPRRVDVWRGQRSKLGHRT